MKKTIISLVVLPVLMIVSADDCTNKYQDKIEMGNESALESYIVECSARPSYEPFHQYIYNSYKILSPESIVAIGDSRLRRSVEDAFNFYAVAASQGNLIAQKNMKGSNADISNKDKVDITVYEMYNLLQDKKLSRAEQEEEALKYKSAMKELAKKNLVYIRKDIKMMEAKIEKFNEEQGVISTNSGGFSYRSHNDAHGRFTDLNLNGHYKESWIFIQQHFNNDKLKYLKDAERMFSRV